VVTGRQKKKATESLSPEDAKHEGLLLGDEEKEKSTGENQKKTEGAARHVHAPRRGRVPRTKERTCHDPKKLGGFLAKPNGGGKKGLKERVRIWSCRQKDFVAEMTNRPAQQNRPYEKDQLEKDPKLRYL